VFLSRCFRAAGDRFSLPNGLRRDWRFVCITTAYGETLVSECWVCSVLGPGAATVGFPDLLGVFFLFVRISRTLCRWGSLTRGAGGGGELARTGGGESVGVSMAFDLSALFRFCDLRDGFGSYAASERCARSFKRVRTSCFACGPGSLLAVLAWARGTLGLFFRYCPTTRPTTPPNKPIFFCLCSLAPVFFFDDFDLCFFLVSPPPHAPPAFPRPPPPPRPTPPPPPPFCPIFPRAIVSSFR